MRRRIRSRSNCCNRRSKPTGCPRRRPRKCQPRHKGWLRMPCSMRSGGKFREQMMKWCRGCRIKKDDREFCVNADNADRLASWCRRCSNAAKRAKYSKNPEKHRVQQRAYVAKNKKAVATLNRAATLREYKMTAKQYAVMLEMQKGLCKMCELPHFGDRPFVVDHCHKTGKIRGLIHTRCNTGIGMLNDDPLMMLKAYFYLAGDTY